MKLALTTFLRTLPPVELLPYQIKQWFSTVRSVVMNKNIRVKSIINLAIFVKHLPIVTVTDNVVIAS